MALFPGKLERHHGGRVLPSFKGGCASRIQGETPVPNPTFPRYRSQPVPSRPSIDPNVTFHKKLARGIHFTGVVNCEFLGNAFPLHTTIVDNADLFQRKTTEKTTTQK